MTELGEMSTTYRGRLDIVGGLSCALGLHSRAQRDSPSTWSDGCSFPKMTTTLAQHFLMAPLMFFTTAVPLPFGALGLTEGVGDQLFKLVGHPSGALAMMGFRVLMYSGGLIGACVYLARLKEVRELTASAHQIEDELLAGENDEPRGNGEPRD